MAGSVASGFMSVKSEFIYGVLPIGESLKTIYWGTSLERCLHFIGIHTESSQIFMTVMRKREGVDGSVELYMTYPFPKGVELSQEELQAQVSRIKDLSSDPMMTKEAFLEKLARIRSAYDSHVKSQERA